MLYLVPKHITETQLQTLFKDRFKKLLCGSDYLFLENDQYNLVVLNQPATEQQHMIMELIYAVRPTIPLVLPYDLQ